MLPEMPELYQMPEENLWEPPVESFKKKNKDKEEEVDTAALPPDDPWYCDPEVESSECPQPCDPEADSDCEVPCHCPLDSDGDSQEFCDLCPDPDVENNTLPVWLRVTTQILASVFEFHVVFLAILPWWLIGIAFILADYIYDWIWYGIFFAFCKPCAWIFIWLLNIPFLFLHIPWWWQRIQLELVGFIFDGWTLFVGGDGCFARWGQDCWFAKKIKERDNMSYTDLVWLMVQQPSFVTASPWQDKYTTTSWVKILGFPGTLNEFKHDMDLRGEQVHKFKVGNPAVNIFYDLKEKVQNYHFDFMDNLQSVGFDW